MEGKNPWGDGKTYEKLFAVMIAISAALSGFAGYLSADAGREAVGAGVVSLKWQTEATFSYDRGMQMIMQDQQLLSDALVQEALGDINYDMTYYALAEELRGMTMCVSMGFVDVDGTGTAAFDDNFTLAWAAYVEYLMADYNNYMIRSDQYSVLSKEKAGEANSYLLATVILAFGTVVAAAGVSLTYTKPRQVMLAIVAVVIVVSSFYIALI